MFIDSEPGSWNMSPQALERAFEWARRENRLPRCVVLVNLYGQSADMDALRPLCERYGVPVLEDAAESLGATYRGRASGSFGRVGIYSFNGNKIITTSGGGMLVADDADLVARARKLASQARDPAPHYEHVEVGFNYRMSNVLAGIGRGQLRVLDQRVAGRRAVHDAYRQGLADVPGLAWMPEPAGMRSTRLAHLRDDRGQGCRRPARTTRCARSNGIRSRRVPCGNRCTCSPCIAARPSSRTPAARMCPLGLLASGLCLPSAPTCPMSSWRA